MEFNSSTFERCCCVCVGRQSQKIERIEYDFSHCNAIAIIRRGFFCVFVFYSSCSFLSLSRSLAFATMRNCCWEKCVSCRATIHAHTPGPHTRTLVRKNAHSHYTYVIQINTYWNRREKRVKSFNEKRMNDRISLLSLWLIRVDVPVAPFSIFIMMIW